MKQTAVTWLLNIIETKNGKEFSSYYSEFISQAKEMEKEQIEDAYSLSRCEWNKIISSSEYYNETYGGKK